MKFIWLFNLFIAFVVQYSDERGMFLFITNKNQPVFKHLVIQLLNYLKHLIDPHTWK